MSNFIELPQIQIASPCHEDWESMDGNDRSRHCVSCQKNVHNLSEMTRAEVRDAINSGESICVRLQRNADGSIKTREPRKTGFRRIAGLAASLLTSLTLAGCAKEQPAMPTNMGMAAPSNPAHTAKMGAVEMGDVCLEIPSAETPEEAPALVGRVTKPLDEYMVNK